MHLRSNAQMLRSGTFDGSEAIELKQSLRTGFQDLREACILAEERSLANPCARGDCPDRHAVNESIHDVLGEKRIRDRETGKDAANLLRDLTIATLTPSGLNEIAECPVVRRYRDAHRALFNLEVDQLLPAPVTGLRSLNSNRLVNSIGRTFSAVTFVSFRRTASVGDTRHLRVRLEGDLRGRRIIAEGLLPCSSHLAVLVFSKSCDFSLQALILLLEDIDPLEEFNLAGRFGKLPICWRHGRQLMVLAEVDE